MKPSHNNNQENGKGFCFFGPALTIRWFPKWGACTKYGKARKVNWHFSYFITDFIFKKNINISTQ